MTSYNILLKTCCLAGRVDLAQDIYKEAKRMESSGLLKLDAFTYCTIIKVQYQYFWKTKFIISFCFYIPKSLNNVLRSGFCRCKDVEMGTQSQR